MTDWRIIHDDARKAMATLEDNSIDLIVADPPYYRVKNLPWDRQWDNPAAFVAWLDGMAQEWQRILKPNGSLYCFASPKMAARVEVMLGERFNVLNSITWAKPKYSTKAEMSKKEDKRSYFEASERVIFGEHFNADNAAKGEAGYVQACDRLRGFVFEPLRAYLDGERQRAGISFEQVRQIVGCSPGSGLPSHWFTSSQWMLPTEENYLKLRAGFSRLDHGGEYLRREYEYLRREYEDLRREYEDLRRPFNLTAHDQYTDVWRFRTVSTYKGKHPTEKPQAMLRHIIKVSSKPGALVLDPFCGSGSAGVAALGLKRRFIGIDASAHWAEYARQRIGGGVQLVMEQIAA